MKITYNWLKDYIDFTEMPEELAEKFTAAGFEVEEYFPLLKFFKNVTVARVEKADKHPNADKLTICDVFDGKDYHQVICGAPNVATGQTVPFAAIGAQLPNGFKLKKVKIRGVESSGMICSKEELGLEQSSDGIWDIQETYPLGDDLFEVLSAEHQDYIFDFSITPNRPDCLSVFGLAREVAAFSGNQLKPPAYNVQEDIGRRAEDDISIKIENTEGCPRYAGRIIRNIKIAPSPQWMQNRLEAVGVRPINNIVDITNFVLMELGHPLHAFDLNEIRDAEINVKLSKPGDKFTTLDDKERDLPPDTVMICDGQRPIAIGGIMGGQNSEVSESTTDILLESAYFNPMFIARSAKKLGLSSEASQRFERGADPNGVNKAINRAAALMAQIAGGTVSSGIVDVYPEKITPSKINFRSERVNKVLGSGLSRELIYEKLRSLELTVNREIITVPTFRVDLLKEIDLIEEVARLVNYSNLPTREITTLKYEINKPESEKQINFLRDQLLELGLQEAVTSSMLKEDEASLFAHGENIRLLNPISDDMTTMRPSLLPGLLKVVNYNINRNISNLRFFEIGRVFTNYNNNILPDQDYALSVVLTGNRYQDYIDTENSDVDFYDIKGILEAFIKKIILDNFQIILYDKSKYFTLDQSAALVVNDEITGICGRIDNSVTKFFGINQPVFAFELNIRKLLPNLTFERTYKAVPRYPYIEKDMALILDKNIATSDVTDFISDKGGNLLNQVEVFDIYKGENIPRDKKSIALRMRFQSAERTLSDEEVDQIFKKLISKSEKAFSASLRN